MSLPRAALDSGARARALSLIALCLSLAACDRIELVVTPESVTFDAEENGSAPLPPLLVTGSIQNLDHPIYVGVTYTTNGVDHAAYSTTDVNIEAGVFLKNPSELSVGTYKDFVTFFACEDENCKQHIRGSPKVIPVTYRVRDPLKVDPPTFATGITIGSSVSSTVPFTLGGADVDWSASSSGWIHLDSTSGTTPSTVTATLDTLALSPGSNESSISFTSKATKVERRVPINLWATLPQLSVPSVLTFGGRTGHDFSPQPLTFSLDTGTNAYPWTATVSTENGRNWLSLETRSGSVSAAPSTVIASVDVSGLTEGVYKARITLTATVGGNTVSREVPVALNVTAHRVLVPDNGVALVSTPTVSKLTRTVTVQDNFGLTTTPWTASSDSAWLSVTPGGKTGGPLTLTANPSGLTPDTLYTATVTLTSSDTSVVNQERLRVGFWVGTSTKELTLSWDSSSRYDAYVQADPIRPYVYLTDATSRLQVYNVYTGTLVTTLDVAGAGLVEMAVSHDGSTLYVSDQSRGRLLPIDLNTFSVGPAFGGAHDFVYARTGGAGFLLSGIGAIIDALTGTHYDASFETPQTWSAGPAVSRDGSTLCFGNKCYALLYAGTMAISSRGVYPIDYLYSDSALNRDGSRIYLADGVFSGVHQFRAIDGETRKEVQTFASAPAVPYWVESGPEDQLVCAAEAPDRATAVWLYDGAGNAQGSLTLANPSDSYVRLALSGDGKRLTLVTLSPPVVRFVNVP